MFISPCSADGGFEVSFKSNVIVNASGNIMWIPPSIFKSSCKIDVEYFPFDEQICRMEFSSWTYNSRQLKLGFYDDISFVNLNDYTFSGTWTIVACPAYIRETKNTTEEETKEVFTFFLKLRRKPLFYTVNMIVPCVLISFMSICVFYLPADAGEKMTMCISTLLAMVVYFVLLITILPPSSKNVPLIAKYLLFTFMINILSLFNTVVVVNWSFRTPRTHRLSKWIRKVFVDILPVVLWMDRPDDDSDEAAGATTPRSPVQSNHTTVTNQPPPLPQHDVRCRHRAAHTLPTTAASAKPLTSDVNKAVEAVRFVATHLKNEDNYSQVRLISTLDLSA